MLTNVKPVMAKRAYIQSFLLALCHSCTVTPNRTKHSSSDIPNVCIGCKNRQDVMKIIIIKEFDHSGVQRLTVVWKTDLWRSMNTPTRRVSNTLVVLLSRCDVIIKLTEVTVLETSLVGAFKDAPAPALVIPTWSLNSCFFLFLSEANNIYFRLPTVAICASDLLSWFDF